MLTSIYTMHATEQALRTGISKAAKRPSVCVVYRGASAQRFARSQPMQRTQCQLAQARDMRSEYSANAAMDDALVSHATPDMLQREAIERALTVVNADVDRQVYAERRLWAFV